MVFVKIESGGVFQNIFSDIAETKSMGMKCQDSMVYALRKIKEPIVANVNICIYCTIVVLYGIL